MIRSIYAMICDLCGTKIELDEHASEKDLTDWARKHGWNVDSKPQNPAYYEPQKHYCLNCKVPVKLAKAMGATP